MITKRIFAVLFTAGFLSGCGLVPLEVTSEMLDAEGVDDTSLTDKTFRISSHPDVASFDRNRPVVICVHGYGACTYEWEEFRDFAAKDSLVYTSLVLMGGHGRDIEDFENSTWHDWQAPIMAEYDTVVKLGFKHISFASSSTGCALILEYMSRKAFDGKSVLPEKFFFIDPIVVSTNKLLTMASVVGPIIGNSPITNQTELELRHWYHNRPSSTLLQLNDAIEVIRAKLESGIKLPSGAYGKVYKSTDDGTADPVSALLIYKGTTDDQGKNVDVEMVDSKLHVFTRVHGRASPTTADTLLQQRVFQEMIDKVTE